MYSSNACQTPLLGDKQLTPAGYHAGHRKQKLKPHAYRRKQWL